MLCILAVPARQRIIDAVPDALKISIAVSVGVFVVVTGLRLAGIIVFENGFPKELGSFISSKASALYIGLAVAVLLGWKRLKFQGGLLVAIIVAAVFCKQQGLWRRQPNCPPRYIDEICKTLNISRATLYRYIKTEEYKLNKDLVR
jgi:xanthine/uracil/vitamin C permease (AzgA family)